ncbi:MAG TPA: hypothetical protein PKD99_16855 [Sphingopyxis sp.]|nr:hypothetical protein [Sphingopyxis sp.]HMP46772.1 hypothetical protein [Sphingopyxis sp.]HMQ17893.1 hypothetical protein [Sphingopyxis sp.]
MRIVTALAPLALLAAAPSALAFETAAPALDRAPKEGEVLRDAGGRVVGKVARVQPSGGVLVIVGGQTARVPADTLSIVDGKLVTSLTRAEAARLK